MSSSVVSRKIPTNIKCVATRRIKNWRHGRLRDANAIATEAIRNAFASIARTGDDASLDDLLAKVKQQPRPFRLFLKSGWPELSENRAAERRRSAPWLGSIGMNAVMYVLAGGLAVVGPYKPAVVNGEDSISYGDLWP